MNRLKLIFALLFRRNPMPAALAVMSEQLKADLDGFAWTWHCNVAMVAKDAGAPHQAANEHAADFMYRAFGVDMRQCKYFPKDPMPLHEFKALWVCDHCGEEHDPRMACAEYGGASLSR